MDGLEKLLAVEDIRRLKARYFRALDLKEWDAYGQLFTTPTVIDFSDQPELWGHGPEDERPDPSDWIFTDGAACAAAIEPLFEGVITTHHGHDPDIEISGETSAHGVWSLYDRLEFPQEIFHGYGHYRDEYELVEGRWRISKLVLTRLRCAWEVPALATES